MSIPRYSASARRDSCGTLLATIRSPTASHALSTDERIGVSGSPDGGQTVNLAPVWWSYQLKNCPPEERSIPSRDVTVRDRRDTSSRRPMKPIFCATTALHMYAPMFVVDVCTDVVPSAFSASPGSPDVGS